MPVTYLSVTPSFGDMGQTPSRTLCTSWQLSVPRPRVGWGEGCILLVALRGGKTVENLYQPSLCGKKPFPTLTGVGPWVKVARHIQVAL